MARKSKSADCPCGQGQLLACCGRFLSGAQQATTAEQLMRSRYSAFALGNEAYLRTTWHPNTLPDEPLCSEDGIQWIALEIRQHRQESERATVEFVARFKLGGRAQRLHEISHFVRQTDASGEPRWYYVDGIFPEPDKK